jgi:hypothetical protein
MRVSGQVVLSYDGVIGHLSWVMGHWLGLGGGTVDGDDTTLDDDEESL